MIADGTILVIDGILNEVFNLNFIGDVRDCTLSDGLGFSEGDITCIL